LKKYDKEDFNNDEVQENKFKETFINSVAELLDFIMFLYAVSPRVNTTIKVSSILSKIIKFIKHKKIGEKKYFNKDQRDVIFKKIFDDISFILSKNKQKKHTQIESLYLLIIIQNLGVDYRLDQKKLFDYFNVIEVKNDKYFEYQLEYWSITVLLFYIKNLKRYKDLRELLKSEIIKKLESYDNIKKNAEAIFLVIDLLSCPYLCENFKRRILDIIPGFKNQPNIVKINFINKIKQNNNWFTKWSNFDFEKELNTKKSKEVY
jgi:hypothetical protein